MAMKDVARYWAQRYFSDEEAVIFFLLLIGGFSIVIFMGTMLAPFLASVVLAYLLAGVVRKLEDIHVPFKLAVVLVFLVFVSLLSALVLVVFPLVWRQLMALIDELPGMLSTGQQLLLLLPEQYPSLISQEQMQELIGVAAVEIGQVGQKLVSLSLASVPNLFAIMIYLVLVPILVFFLLKDRDLLINWFVSHLPEKRVFMTGIWREMDQQLANYIRGKFIEIVIVGVATYLGLIAFGVQYSALLGVLVGLSVLVPYIGAAVVTVPVVLIGMFQFGLNDTFFYMLLVYGVIQALDGNVLVPLLFSEAVNLHPVAIIVAVLAFGGIWGFWGIFFAIPLATLLKAILYAWPRAVDATEPAAVAE
ncbi:AI-2E family transporter [Oceanospirillum sanctuarii]|uniref:AI-2E family transporter n=1 Tax=Oceanospirillum sanctuarii TaxID=1434821 RepID=UPI000A3A36C5|nr:AI-2E family transporter [Oceanospirillum sanctuarii]